MREIMRKHDERNEIKTAYLERWSKTLHAVVSKIPGIFWYVWIWCIVTKREKDVLDPSDLDQSNAIDKVKIEIMQKNDGHGLYYYCIKNKYHYESC